MVTEKPNRDIRKIKGGQSVEKRYDVFHHMNQASDQINKETNRAEQEPNCPHLSPSDQMSAL